MNAYTSSGRVCLHLAALAHRPNHLAFHARGVGRELHDTGLNALLIGILWMGVWLLVLL